MIYPNYSVEWLEDLAKREDASSLMLSVQNLDDGGWGSETVAHALIRRYVGDWVARLRRA